MKRIIPKLSTIFLLAAQLTGCGSASGPIQLNNTETKGVVAPSSFVDNRPESSKRTFTDRNKTRYGDDTLKPSATEQLWGKLIRALKDNNLPSQPTIILEEIEVVVTLPRAEDAAMGGPLVYLADRKYILVNISGKAESRNFAFGVYKKQFTWPDESDIALAVDEAIEGAVNAIIKELKAITTTPERLVKLISTS